MDRRTHKDGTPSQFFSDKKGSRLIVPLEFIIYLTAYKECAEKIVRSSGDYVNGELIKLA